MAHTTDLTPTSPPPRPTGPNPPAGTQANPSGVDARLGVGNPNAPPAEEVSAAAFASREDADRVAADLVAAGVPRECLVVTSDEVAKREFLSQYVRPDADRHSHSATGSVFTGAAGAGVLGLIAVLIATGFRYDILGILLFGIIGGVIGAVIGVMLGGLAFRQADDRGVEVVDQVATSGTLVAVRRPFGADSVSLDEVGRILTRHGGRALRINPQFSQADLHSGDTRPDQM